MHVAVFTCRVLFKRSAEHKPGQSPHQVDVHQAGDQNTDEKDLLILLLGQKLFEILQRIRKYKRRACSLDQILYNGMWFSNPSLWTLLSKGSDRHCVP